jgi:hypothetical protein
MQSYFISLQDRADIIGRCPFMRPPGFICARRVAARVERKSKEMDTAEQLVVEILAVLAATGCECPRRRPGIIHQAVSIGETGGPDRLEVLPPPCLSSSAGRGFPALPT